MKKIILAIVIVMIAGNAWGQDTRFTISYYPQGHVAEINTLDLLITGAWSDTAWITAPIYFYACPMSMTVFAEMLQGGIVQDSWYAKDMVTGQRIKHIHGWYLLDFRSQQVRNAVLNSIGAVIQSKRPAGIFLDHGEFWMHENNYVTEDGAQAFIHPEILGSWRQFFIQVIKYIKMHRKQVIINAEPSGYFAFKNYIDGIYVEDYRDAPGYQHGLYEQMGEVIEAATSARKMVLIDPLNKVNF